MKSRLNILTKYVVIGIQQDLLRKIVSDTTTFWFRKRKYDWTFYLDVFNNEIVGYDVRDSMHGNGIINHREALNDMLNNKIKKRI